MNIRKAILATMALAAVSTTPCWAQTMKPGLWEINNKMTSDDGKLAAQMEMMQKQLASMPPEQRKMLEGMMAKHAGVNMPTMKDGGMLVKVCMSKEMADQQRFPMQEQGNCTHQRAPAVGNTMKVSFSCTNPASSGQGEVRFMGDQAYVAKMNVTAAHAGQKQTMVMEARANWLGPDCGDIKPVPMPPAKSRP